MRVQCSSTAHSGAEAEAEAHTAVWGGLFFLALQLTFSTRLPAYCLLIFLSHVLITKTPTFVIAGLYQLIVSCGVLWVFSVTRQHAASGTRIAALVQLQLHPPPGPLNKAKNERV